MAQLSPEAADKLREGVDLLLGKWDVFQFAVQNQPQRAQQLPVDIYQWLTRPSGALNVRELEDLLEGFWFSLDTTIDNASILQAVTGGEDYTDSDFDSESTPSFKDEFEVYLRLTNGGPTNDGCKLMAVRELRKRG